MTSSRLLNAGPFFLSETNKAPVYVETSSGTPALGLTLSDFTFNYNIEGATGFTPWSPSAGQFVEVGLGHYEAKLPSTLFTTLGQFLMVPVPTDITKAASAVWGLVTARRDNIITRCSFSYDVDNLRMAALVWLESNGQTITTPTSCTLVMTPEGTGAPERTVPSSSPNPDGVFPLAITGWTPACPQVYEAKASVVYNGVTYTTVWSYQHFK